MSGILYRHNVMSVTSIETFLNVKGGYNNGFRDVYFIRGLGEPADFLKMIQKIDLKMSAEGAGSGVFYIRAPRLPQLSSVDDGNFYLGSYEEWKKNGTVRLKSCSGKRVLEKTLGTAANLAAERWKEIKQGSTATIEKNFVIKLFFWADFLLKDILPHWTEKSCIKILAYDVTKAQEYLFYYMLTLIGCDVLLLENKCDIEITESLKELSAGLKLGDFGATDLPEYAPYTEKAASQEHAAQEEKAEHTHQKKIKTVIPKHPEREKSFEELARLASSIVMITVHNSSGEPIAAGSGIMTGRKGFILTNNHVISGGCFFTVQIEDDEETYTTDEVVKYNYVLDLAVIRIKRELKILPIYGGERELARGQKVVAIGSPLGMFNTVSDGIISGFRRINGVDMIQFTAPTSHGSSGGAVLNMQGEVIGISTAGIDSGQNINLAVGYESIRTFAKGFYETDRL